MKDRKPRSVYEVLMVIPAEECSPEMRVALSHQGATLCAISTHGAKSCYLLVGKGIDQSAANDDLSRKFGAAWLEYVETKKPELEPVA